MLGIICSLDLNWFNSFCQKAVKIRFHCPYSTNPDVLRLPSPKPWCYPIAWSPFCDVGKFDNLEINFLDLRLSQLKKRYNSKSVLVLYISLPARNTIEECVWFIFGRFIPAAVVGWCEAFLIWSAHQQKSIFIHIITKPHFCVLFFLWGVINPTIHGKKIGNWRILFFIT